MIATRLLEKWAGYDLKQKLARSKATANYDYGQTNPALESRSELSKASIGSRVELAAAPNYLVAAGCNHNGNMILHTRGASDARGPYQ